ncbi:MAG: hypothetical protein AB7E48_07275 [Deferribacterales bacterium]
MRRNCRTQVSAHYGKIDVLFSVVRQRLLHPCGVRNDVYNSMDGVAP